MYFAFLIDFVVFFFITIQSNFNMTEIQHKTNIYIYNFKLVGILPPAFFSMVFPWVQN